MTELTSVQNPTIKRIKALKDKKARETQGEMLVEGEKLMLEAGFGAVERYPIGMAVTTNAGPQSIAVIFRGKPRD